MTKQIEIERFSLTTSKQFDEVIAERRDVDQTSDLWILTRSDPRGTPGGGLWLKAYLAAAAISD